jgi:hypothetical protein
MRRLLTVCALGALSIPFASAADRGGVSVGVTAGVPILDLFNATSSSMPPRFSYSALTNRYTIGPSVEFRFPGRFGVVAEGLFTHGSYNSTLPSVDTLATSRTTADFWQVPLMLRYRVFDKGVAPFVEGGASFRYVGSTGTTRTLFVLPSPTGTTVAVPNPVELTNRFTSGFVAGGGVDFHAKFVHIAPEIRYTRWGWENFQQGLFHSNLNQVEFLLGIRF